MILFQNVVGIIIVITLITSYICLLIRKDNFKQIKEDIFNQITTEEEINLKYSLYGVNLSNRAKSIFTYNVNTILSEYLNKICNNYNIYRDSISDKKIFKTYNDNTTHVTLGYYTKINNIPIIRINNDENIKIEPYIPCTTNLVLAHEIGHYMDDCKSKHKCKYKYNYSLPIIHDYMEHKADVYGLYLVLDALKYDTILLHFIKNSLIQRFNTIDKNYIESILPKLTKDDYKRIDYIINKQQEY
jgi:hypothetical protein